MAPSVQIHSTDPDGSVRTITLTQTAAGEAHIDIEYSAAPGSKQSWDLRNVTADPASITIVCKIEEFPWGNIRVVVQPATAAQPPVATITVSHAILGDGAYVYSLAAGEDANVRAFLQRANFPLAAGV